MFPSISAIGIMSGTSMDGVDLAYCTFSKTNERWSYAINAAETIPYTPEWKERLRSLMSADAVTYASTHVELGKLFGDFAKQFIYKHNCAPKLIASHGHTIFHQPQNGFTSQIGDGSSIAAFTGVDTICDFRSKDVALGGQGAPLVPVGDQLLFQDYNVCMNLGGIANLSYQKNNQLIAYDICPVNIVMNHLALTEGKEFDEDGRIAQSGTVDADLLSELNQLDYYQQSYPKSIGKEWVDDVFLPVINSFDCLSQDKMCTIYEHAATKISSALNEASAEKLKVLITGGGAFNKFFLQLLKTKTNHNLILPDDKTIAYKEALIFAFLGVLFLLDEVNVMSSVTGSKRNHIGGAFYKGK